MKRILLTVLLLAGMTLGATAQKTVTKKAPTKKPATKTAVEKTYILTDKGVDVLVFDQKLQLQPPAGSVYDRAVKTSVNDYNVVFYDLKKNGKKIGQASVSEGKVAGLYIDAKNVQLDNGIKVGDRLSDVLEKPGVTAKMWYNFMDGFCEITISYNGITIHETGSSTGVLSAVGEKKMASVEKKAESWDFDQPQPEANLTKEDFMEGLTVGGFGMGIQY